MLRIFFQVTLIFLEIILVLIGAVGSVLLIQEYLRTNKKVQLIFASLALFCTGIAQLLVLSGQIIASKGNRELGTFLVSAQAAIILPGSLAILLYLIAVYSKRFRSLLFASVTFFITFFSVLFALSDFHISRSIYGALYPGNTSAEFALYLLPLNTAFLFLFIVAVVAYRRQRKPADLYLAYSGAFGLSMFFFGAMVNAFNFVPGALLMMLALFLHLVLFLFGAMAKSGSDSFISKRPLNLVKQSLSSEIAIIIIFSFLVLALSLSAVNSYHFSNTSLKSERGRTIMAIEHDAEMYTNRIEQQNLNLSLVAQVITQKNNIQEISSYLEEITSSDLNWFIEVTDQNQKIVWSNLPRVNLTELSAMSIQSSTKVETNFSEQEILDNADLTEESTNELVVRIVSLLSPNEIIQQSGHNSMVHQGIVDSSGMMIYNSGPEVDLELRQHLLTQVVGAQSAVLGSGFEMAMYGAIGLDNPAGTIDGLIYHYISEAEWDTYLFSGLINTAGVSVILGFMLMVLFFFMLHLALQPVKDLDLAAKMVARGKQGVVIDDSKPNELGRLAHSFNIMSNAIKQQTESLREKVREQRDFVNYIAHELKTPIGGMRWTIELLLNKEVRKTKAYRDEMLNQVLKENDSMRDLINDLLDFSRIERGVLKLQRGDFDILTAVNEALDARNLEFKEAEMKIDIWHSKKKIPIIQADSVRIRQVLDNIIGNAFKYGKSGGRINIKIGLSKSSGLSGKAGNYIRVSVQDYGMGIPKNQQSHIFKKFFRADNAVGSGVEGTGLGLHMANRLVCMHGGEMWFVSRQGRGSTFSFTLPVKSENV